MTPDGFILNQVELAFDPVAATVGQVNSAIQSVNGSIVSMEAGVWSLTIQVPLASNAAALQQVADSLAGMPSIIGAFPAREPTGNSWPNTNSVAPVANLQHLAAIRALAAFNTVNNLAQANKYPCPCAGNGCPAVFVPDDFNTVGPPGEPTDFVMRLSPSIYGADAAGIYSGSSVPIADIPSTGPPAHGNAVAAVLGAGFFPPQSATDPTDDANNAMLGADALAGGTTGAQSCVNVIALQLDGLGYDDSEKRVSKAVKSYITRSYNTYGAPNSVIVSSSDFGFPSDCTLAGTNQKVLCAAGTDLPTNAYQRAMDAMTWRWRMAQTSPEGDTYANHILIAVSAGNSAPAQGLPSGTSLIWPGIGAALTDSALTLATATTDLSAIAGDSDLWGSQQAGIGDLTAPLTGEFSVATLAAYEQGNPQNNTSDLGNTLIVGSLQPPVPEGMSGTTVTPASGDSAVESLAHLAAAASRATSPTSSWGASTVFVAAEVARTFLLTVPWGRRPAAPSAPISSTARASAHRRSPESPP